MKVEPKLDFTDEFFEKLVTLSVQNKKPISKIIQSLIELGLQKVEEQCGVIRID